MGTDSKGSIFTENLHKRNKPVSGGLAVSAKKLNKFKKFNSIFYRLKQTGTYIEGILKAVCRESRDFTLRINAKLITK